MNTASLRQLAYSPDTAAQAVGLSAKTIRRAINRGELAAKKLGSRRIVITEHALTQWLNNLPDA